MQLIYKKWTFNILLNNLIINNFICFQKKIYFLQFDIYKYFFYNFSKTTRFLNPRIILLKNKIKYNS